LSFTSEYTYGNDFLHIADECEYAEAHEESKLWPETIVLSLIHYLQSYAKISIYSCKA
jgi:hypothetical protein